MLDRNWLIISKTGRVLKLNKAGDAAFKLNMDGEFKDCRNVWKLKPSAAKELAPGLKATLDYEWRFKDYLAGNDGFQNIVRVGVEGGF